MKDHEAISSDVIDVATRLYREHGLLESVYETVLASKLASMGRSVVRQQPVEHRI